MGQQSLIYSFVARGTVVLAEFTGNFTSIASQGLQKLPSSNKFTYNCDGHTFNYLVEDGFTPGESLLQIQLLTALKNFVTALGYQSPICYNMLLPILRCGIDVNSPDELLEDSMLLWEATLSQAPSMVPQLLGYFPSLLEILERSFDHLKVAANIIEGYIILGGTDFLSLHASTVAKLLDLVVGNVNDRGLLSILPVIEILIQRSHASGDMNWGKFSIQGHHGYSCS